MAEGNGSVATAVQGGQGVFLTGEFLSVKPGREWEGSDGKTRSPYNITLLVGDSAMRVEARTEADASDAVRGLMRGDPLTLPVYVRAVKDRAYFSLALGTR